MKLIEINKNKFDVAIDLKYAGKDNIVGKKIFLENKCLLHPEAASKLLKASEI